MSSTNSQCRKVELREHGRDGESNKDDELGKSRKDKLDEHGLSREAEKEDHHKDKQNRWEIFERLASAERRKKFRDFDKSVDFSLLSVLYLYHLWRILWRNIPSQKL